MRAVLAEEPGISRAADNRATRSAVARPCTATSTLHGGVDKLQGAPLINEQAEKRDVGKLQLSDTCEGAASGGEIANIKLRDGDP